MGKLNEFDLKDGNWKSYCDRLEMYFLVNSVKDELKVPTLITHMGEAAYELLVNLCSPRKPSTLSYNAITEMLSDHLQPRPSILAERFKFRQRRQLIHENISDYVAELKRLSRHCEFGSTLDDNLRDQLACGIKSDIIRQRLFAEKDVSFTKAVSLSSALEAAERDAAAVHGCADAGGTAGSGGTMAPVASSGATSRRSSSGADIAGAVNRMQIGACTACGDMRHTRKDCRFTSYECSKCGKVGHLRRVCRGNLSVGEDAGRRGGRGRGAGRGRRARTWRPGAKVAERAETYWAEEDEEGHRELETDDEPIYQMSLSQYRPVSIQVQVNNVLLPMEVDTGSPLSCIGYKTYKDHFSQVALQKSSLSVKFYNGSKVKPVGYLEVNVTYNKIVKKLDLYVFDTGTTSLLGRQWLAELNIRIPSIDLNNVSIKKELGGPQRSELIDDVICRYSEVFDGGLGCFTGGRASLELRSGARPVFCRARPLPYSLRARVDAELDEMLRAGVIEPVASSDWATPLVIVHKPDGSLRICADYKVTLNKVLKVDKYPVPKIDDLFSKLSGSAFFTKLDLSQAYNQIMLDESRELTVINTHKGLFRYNRLVYGLASSPGIFQRMMVKLFENVPNVTIFLDDILITGTSEKSNLDTLNTVLQILNDYGLKIKRKKCDFLCTEVKYLGFIINREGIRVDPDKTKAIINLSAPTNISELRSFLGMINFYGKFIKNLSFYLSPLYELLKKGKHWIWGREHERAFVNVKKLLVSCKVLVHYDESQPLVLTCDASARGLGAVLAQRGARAERPVAYASRALTQAEYNYSQIHKEALAIVFAVKKFHQYLYGRHFVLRTDHKPLVSIFGSDSGVPNMTASRLQRWALLLSAYNFSIEYVSTDNNTADALSRLVESYKARDVTNGEIEVPEQTYLHFASEALSLKYEDIKAGTSKDPILSRVLSYVKDGWPREVEVREIKPYANRRNELYIELGCLMWGHRLVVPSNCQDTVLRELHDTHMGIVKTKSIARSYVWWPGIDEAVEAMCRACGVCAEAAEAPPQHAPQPWPWPTRPWSRVHVDFLGPIFGEKYLIMIDACSKWIEVCKMQSTTAKVVIGKVREIWARFGIPRQLVSDNGPPFSSDEFNTFLKSNGVEHVFSAPYHPASNGLAENAVKICKRVIKKAEAQKLDIDMALQRYLLVYRTTEHSTTKESPSQILQGRTLRTRFDRLKPARETQVAAAQERQRRAAGGAVRALQCGDAVWCRVYQGQRKWVEGTVIDRLGSTDYTIELLGGTVVHRHIDQLKLKSKKELSLQLTDSMVGTKYNNIQGSTGLLRGPLVFPVTDTAVCPMGSEVTGSPGIGEDGSGGPGRENNLTGELRPETHTRSQAAPPSVTDVGDHPRPTRTRRPPDRYCYP